MKPTKSPGELPAKAEQCTTKLGLHTIHLSNPFHELLKKSIEQPWIHFTQERRDRTMSSISALKLGRWAQAKAATSYVHFQHRQVKLQYLWVVASSNQGTVPGITGVSLWCYKSRVTLVLLEIEITGNSSRSVREHHDHQTFWPRSDEGQLQGASCHTSSA